MKKMTEYPIKNFYIGELYLYKKFANLLTGETIEEGENKIQKFIRSGAINFQQDLESRYIDWENAIEYNGFLTIFYKKDDKYICLHDGKTYELNNTNIVTNLFMMKELLPKIDTKKISKITMYEALQIFDLLFKEDQIDQRLYLGREQKTSDFYVGDIILQEKTLVEIIDTRYEYIDLPHHLMLEKSNLLIHSYIANNYINNIYRCLFLKDGVDLYNLNNHQFYNPNEDSFESIISFQEYMMNFDIEISKEKTTIPKSLKLFKKTI